MLVRCIGVARRPCPQTGCSAAGVVDQHVSSVSVTSVAPRGLVACQDAGTMSFPLRGPGELTKRAESPSVLFPSDPPSLSLFHFSCHRGL